MVYLLALVFASVTALAQDAPDGASSPAGGMAGVASAAASPGLDQSTGAAAGAVTLLNLVWSGGPAMIPLALLSILTVMLVIVYAFTLRRGAIVTARFMSTADVFLKKRDYLGLLAISARHGEAIARVLQRTLDFLTKNPGVDFSVVREIAETEGNTQAASLQQRIVFLADIGMLSPMIGLLGTVFGIIHSFGVLAKNTSGSRPAVGGWGVGGAGGDGDGVDRGDHGDGVLRYLPGAGAEPDLGPGDRVDAHPGSNLDHLCQEKS